MVISSGDIFASTQLILTINTHEYTHTHTHTNTYMHTYTYSSAAYVIYTISALPDISPHTFVYTIRYKHTYIHTYIYNYNLGKTCISCIGIAADHINDTMH